MEYNDYATLDFDKFETVAKEYARSVNVFKTCSLENKNVISAIKTENNETLSQKLDYLNGLINNLKTNTRNQNLKNLIELLEFDVQNYSSRFKRIFGDDIHSLSEENLMAEMFCNNLKLAIQTSLEIEESLIFALQLEADQSVKDVIKSFIKEMFQFSKRLVSLFGDCKYRR